MIPKNKDVLQMSTDSLVSRERGLTIPTTAVFIVGSMAGTGVLALPKALDNTGWTGLILLLVFAILSVYTSILLGEAWTMAADIFEDCKGHVQNPYPLLAQKTFGLVGRYTVSAGIYISLFGSNVVILLVIGDNMETLFQDLGYDVPTCEWLVAIAGCVTPFTWFGTPKDFWWMAYGAVATTALCVVIIAVICGLDASNQPSVQHQDADLQRIILGIGIILFAYGGHPVFLTFQMDMKRQKDFKLAAIIAFISILFMYLTSSLSGYIVYGKKLEDNILNNLPYGVMYYIVVVLITLHLLLGIVLNINPVMQDVELKLRIPTDFTWKRCVSRSVIIACLLFVSATIPKFSSVQSLLGGSVFVLLCIIFPVLFHMKMCQITQMNNNDSLEMKKQKVIIPLWKRVMNYEIIGIGVLVGIVTSVSAIINIISPNSFSMPCYVNVAGT